MIFPRRIENLMYCIVESNGKTEGVRNTKNVMSKQRQRKLLEIRRIHLTNFTPKNSLTHLLTSSHTRLHPYRYVYYIYLWRLWQQDSQKANKKIYIHILNHK